MNWFVGVAEHRRDELAENELIARGFDVHIPRSWSRRRTYDGHMRMGYDLTHVPYFYVRFDGASKEEYALIRRQRGVMGVLESTSGKPGAVLAKVIDDHRDRERAERANIKVAKGKGRSDLVLLAEYRILRGPFEGKNGKLFDFSRGMASLDCSGIKVDIADCDIDLAREAKRGAA